MNQVYNLFDQLKFRQEQLEAMRLLYARHFLPQMPPAALYNGKGIIALWGDMPSSWTPGQGPDRGHGHHAMLLPHVGEDPLWAEYFGDLLPYMNTNATITRMPAGAEMKPHVDRRERPNAIYFPIEGCTEACVSECYDLPVSRIGTIAQVVDYWPQAIARYSITEQAVLTNVHAWHSVRNRSHLTRTAIGWNMKGADMNYEEHRTILGDLGYL